MEGFWPLFPNKHLFILKLKIYKKSWGVFLFFCCVCVGGRWYVGSAILDDSCVLKGGNSGGGCVCAAVQLPAGSRQDTAILAVKLPPQNRNKYFLTVFPMTSYIYILIFERLQYFTACKLHGRHILYLKDAIKTIVQYVLCEMDRVHLFQNIQVNISFFEVGTCTLTFTLKSPLFDVYVELYTSTLA